MKLINKLLDLSERPDGFGKKFEEIDGLFTSNYVFASKYVKGKVILDSGCGAGYGTSFLSDKGASKVVAIDYHKKTIKKNKEIYKKSNLSFICMNGTKLSFENNFFDVITSFEVIEHIKDYEKYLSECIRVLKNGGYFILSTPNKKKFSPNTKNPIIVSHFKEFTYAELIRLLNISICCYKI